MRRLISPAALALSLLSLSVSLWMWGYHAKPSAIAPAAAPTRPAHLMAASAGGSYEWYDNARATKVFYVTDPIFAGGAKGDCSTDDTAAIQAANAAGQAVNGGVVYFPTPPGGCYLVNAEIQVEYRAHWKGDNYTVNQNVIRANTLGMRSILAVRSTFGHPLTEGGGAYGSMYEDLTFDANNKASNAILCWGCAYSEFRHVRTLNAPQACIREALYYQGLTLSSVTATVPGGSPSGVTVSQLDPQYFGFPQGQMGGTYPLALQITVGGALDTAQFVISVDGGVTYSTFAQPVSAKSNIAYPVAGNFSAISGLQAQFPAGTYHVGDTYSLTYTAINGDIGFPVTSNWYTRYDNDSFEYCGQAYDTAGASVGGGITSCNFSAATGTIATTAGSPFIIGTGTHFTTQAMAGWSREYLWAGGGSFYQNFYQVAALSDTVLVVVHRTEPTTTVSGLDYAIGVGGGLYNDGLNEISGQLMTNNKFDLTSTGFSNGDYIGATMIHNEYTNTCFFGASLGGSTPASDSYFIVGENVTSQCRIGYYLAPGSTGTITDQGQHAFTSYTGSGAGWIGREQGQEFQLAPSGALSNLPIQTIQMAPPSPFTFVTGAETMPAPGILNPASNGNGSLREFSSTSALVLSGVPVLSPAGQDGILVFLFNIGSYPVTFQANAWASSRLMLTSQYVTLTQYSTLPLMSRGNYWAQTGPVVSLYANGTGDQSGSGGKTIKTTNATPVTIWDAYVLAAGGLNQGSALKFDLKAQARGGLDAAFWNDCAVFDDGAANRLGFKCSTYVYTAGNAATWTMAVNHPTNFEDVVVTGDASGNPVYWSIDATQKSPSYTY